MNPVSVCMGFAIENFVVRKSNAVSPSSVTDPLLSGGRDGGEARRRDGEPVGGDGTVVCRRPGRGAAVRRSGALERDPRRGDGGGGRGEAAQGAGALRRRHGQGHAVPRRGGRLRVLRIGRGREKVCRPRDWDRAVPCDNILETDGRPRTWWAK